MACSILIRRGLVALLLSLGSARGADWRPELAQEVKGMPIEEVFARYEVAQFQKRSHATYLRELMGRTNLVEFLKGCLQKDLSKPDTKARIAQREKAVVIAGHLGERAGPIVPLLVAALEDEESVRHGVGNALAELGPVAIEAKSALLEELHFQNPLAARALFRMDPLSEDILKAVIDAISDPSSDQMFRSQLLDAFYECKAKSDAARKFLEKIAADKGAPLSPAAENQLRMQDMKTRRMSFVEPSEQKAAESDAPKLLERLTANPTDYPAARALATLSPEVQEKAVTGLIMALRENKTASSVNSLSILGLFGANAKSALPMLIQYAGADDSGPANNALAAIGAIGSAAIEAKPVAEAALQDGSSLLRWRAAYTLCQIDPERMEHYLPTVIDALQEEGEDVSGYGLRSLGNFGTKAISIAPALERFLEKDQTRMAAAQALIKIRPGENARLAPVIAKDLSSDSIYTRQQAAQLLGEMGSAAREQLPQLRKAVRGDDAEFNKIAEQAIQKIEEAK